MAPGANLCRHARCFAIFKSNGITRIELIDPLLKGSKTSYTLLPAEAPIPPGVDPETVIRIPIQRCAVLSTTYLPAFEDLQCLEAIQAIADRRQVTSESIRALVDQGRIKEIGDERGLDREGVLALGIDSLFTFGISEIDASKYTSIRELGVRVFWPAEYKESTPLGRAEWIRFFGELLGEGERAERRFAEIERNYEQLANLVRQQAGKRPTVLTGAALSGTWWVPGANNHLAKLIEDAGGVHLWHDRHSTESVPLTFETVFDRGRNADVWIHTLQWGSLQEALLDDERYANFRAFKNGTVFNNIGRVTKEGANDFWERGVASPDLVLRDLIAILHPEILPDHKLVYYRRLMRESSTQEVAGP